MAANQFMLDGTAFFVVADGVIAAGRRRDERRNDTVTLSDTDALTMF